MTDPNDRPFASAAPAAAVPSFAPPLITGAATPGLAAPAALVPSFAATLASTATPASEAPAVEALIVSPSAAMALGTAAPALSAAAPDVAQYANPLLQTVASHDLNAPFGAMGDRVANIGQSHTAEDARSMR